MEHVYVLDGPRQSFGVSDYVKKANDQTMIVVLIEDIKAVNNLDDILAVKGLTGVTGGPHDFSARFQND